MLRKIVNLGVLVACLALSGCAYYGGHHFSGHYHFGTHGPGYYSPGYYRQPSFHFGFSWHSPVFRWRYWHHRYPENALGYPDESLICLGTDDPYPTDIVRWWNGIEHRAQAARLDSLDLGCDLATEGRK